VKRKTLEVQRKVLKTIRANKVISMSSLERKIGTNPRSLKEHCEQLADFELIKIKRTEKTTQLIALK